MTTKTITAAALRNEAAKQKVGKPSRFGIEYSWYNADNLDNAIIERQQAAIAWRNALVNSMELEGITKLTAKTVRYRHFYSRVWLTATLYLYTDGSVFCYRRKVNNKQGLAFDWNERIANNDIVVAVTTD